MMRASIPNSYPTPATKDRHRPDQAKVPSVRRGALLALCAGMLPTTASWRMADNQREPECIGEQTAATNAFPLTICGDRFCRNGAPVFLHILDYQPLLPCQHPVDPPAVIDEARVLDDLRRLQAYHGGSDPVVLRLYLQPIGLRYMPRSFFDGLRNLGFWIIPDIYCGL